MQSTGLLGFITAIVNGIRIDGIALRETLEGEITLSYPTRCDSQGRLHPVVLPATREARNAVESQILSSLQAQGWIEP